MSAQRLAQGRAVAWSGLLLILAIIALSMTLGPGSRPRPPAAHQLGANNSSDGASHDTSVGSAGSTQAIAAAGPVTSPRPSAPVEAPDPFRQSLRAVLIGAEPAREVLAAEAMWGETDPRTLRLRDRLDEACRAVVLLRLDGSTAGDPYRDWARRELEARCRDWPEPSLYAPTEDTRSPVLDAAPDAAAVAQALALLRHSQDEGELLKAWLLAMRPGAIAQEELFVDGRRLLPTESEELAGHALVWLQCQRQGACGPDSLYVLRLCALGGCRPGSHLLEAYEQALSPREFQAVRAIHDWLLRWRHADA